MGVFKKGAEWWIDYYVDGRRERRCIGPSHKAAMEALKARKGEIARGEYKIGNDGRGTVFDELVKQYLEWSQVNKRSHERDVTSTKALLGTCEEGRALFAGKRLVHVTPGLIERYKTLRVKKVSRASVNRELSCLRHMFTKAIEWGLTGESAFPKAKLFKEEPRELRTLSPDEEKLLLGCVADYVEPIVITALHTGMRKREILDLTWDRVDLDNRRIVLVHTKSGKKRGVPINQTLTATLEELKLLSRSRYVFPDENGKPYGDIKKGFAAAVRRARISHIRFHDLRHTFASRLLMANVPLITVSRILGHASIKITADLYGHLTEEHQLEAVEKLDMVPDGHLSGDFGGVAEIPQVVSH